MDLGEGGTQHHGWPGHAPGGLWGPAGHPDAFVHAAGGLDQLLAAQLHALHLGAAMGPAAYPAAGRVPSTEAGALQQGPACAVPLPRSPGSADQASPQELCLGSGGLGSGSLGSGDLLSQLRLGSGLAHHSPSLGLSTPSPPQHHPLPHLLQHPQLGQQQELAPLGGAAQDYLQPPGGAPQQHPRPPPGGRRRGGGGGVRRNEDKVRRTVYISDICDAVSEAQLACFFQDCGQLVDCRVCGDPNSTMRFAFIEFTEEAATHQALSKNGAVLGDYPIRVHPSKTAIVPVNNTYLPRSSEERELAGRTVFVGNVDRVVERDQLRDFFHNLCGPVAKIRLLGDSQHNSKIAFVEFCTAQSAKDALRLSGALLGTLLLRISPSKTPVRGDSRRLLEGRNGVPAPLPAAIAHDQASLSPALLMATAGLQAYPSQFPG